MGLPLFFFLCALAYYAYRSVPGQLADGHKWHTARLVESFIGYYVSTRNVYTKLIDIHWLRPGKNRTVKQDRQVESVTGQGFTRPAPSY